ncbi:MAG TPA: serine/threonine protein kinase, partial [Armatimonadetes bacterium]|nr:serine/threonine protein kinase [Armatimonadota bacterium]
MIGTVIKHRYELIEKIGEGNLFSVYKCEDKIENRLVAMKILLPQYSADRMFAERLLVEAKAMVGVAHPGIVEVYDCGEQEGIYFVIVEYVRGVDLRERIRRSAPFTPSTAVDAGMAICEVIDFAHKHGFVHGDLRPGN